MRPYILLVINTLFLKTKFQNKYFFYFCICHIQILNISLPLQTKINKQKVNKTCRCCHQEEYKQQQSLAKYQVCTICSNNFIIHCMKQLQNFYSFTCQNYFISNSSLTNLVCHSAKDYEVFNLRGNHTHQEMSLRLRMFAAGTKLSNIC